MPNHSQNEVYVCRYHVFLGAAFSESPMKIHSMAFCVYVCVGNFQMKQEKKTQQKIKKNLLCTIVPHSRSVCSYLAFAVNIMHNAQDTYTHTQLQRNCMARYVRNNV